MYTFTSTAAAIWDWCEMADGEQSIFEAPETIGRMLVTTWALLYSMDGDQRRACEFPMADPGRVDWDFVPKPDRQGIPLSRLDAHQRRARELIEHLPGQGERCGIRFGSCGEGDGHVQVVDSRLHHQGGGEVGRGQCMALGGQRLIRAGPGSPDGGR